MKLNNVSAPLTMPQAQLAKPLAEIPAEVRQNPGIAFGQQPPAKGPVVIGAQQPAAPSDWTDKLLKYAGMLPGALPGAFLATKVLPGVIQDFKDIWSGFMGLFGGQPAPAPAPAPKAAAPVSADFDRRLEEAFAMRDANGDGQLTGVELGGSDLVTDAAFNLNFDEANDGAVTRERYAERVREAMPGIRTQEAQHQARKKADIARAFQSVYGYHINEASYPFFLGLLKEGKSMAEVQAVMLDHKQTRDKYFNAP